LKTKQYAARATLIGRSRQVAAAAGQPNPGERAEKSTAPPLTIAEWSGPRASLELTDATWRSHIS